VSTEQRKLVSVVFADVVGSTAFGSDTDPEAVRSVMGSYFERMKAIAELHGGTVEKFIGDAVMVVFGVPRLHDDDAERAVRAALAMRDEMTDLNAELRVALSARVGVNSGEAVAGGGRERQFLVTGDAVNVAARLQQGAEAGEVVVGALTESLTRAAIEYEERPAIAAKGKAEPMRAFRAVRPRSAVPEQARGLPAMRAQLVGRQRELRLLLDTFERVRTERRAHLFTLVGNAGIGKSRLVGEVLARIAATADARVLRGRCLPYGAGITYWPLMEILRADAGIGSDDGREAAIAKLERRTAQLFATGAGAVRSRLAAMLGLQPVEEALAEVAAEDVPREIAWGVREYLASVARDPSVVVIDDLQWAEPAVFDILEGLAERAEDAPLLLVCVARPQLLESHPGWAAGRANAATITLDALSGEETTTLISRLLDVDDLPADLRARVVQRSEGNPLFCEEFLRMLIDEGRVERVADRWRATASAADVRVPESIHALLAARLDGLADDERRAIQVASIVGERFSGSELRALAPDLDVSRALGGLRRSGLVQEDRETREPERYRFKHLLMRDVAYAGMPKASRADLHDAFAAQFERAVGDRRDEYAEILAHHAERAFTLSTEVRAAREVTEPRARRVLDWALALGERARRRQDRGLLAPHAATAAAALAALGDGGSPEDLIGVALLSASERQLASAYDAARAAFEDAARLAAEAGRPHLEAQAHLGAAASLVFGMDESDVPAFRQHVADAERLFRETGDAGGEIEAGLIGLERLWGGGEMAELVKQGAALRERARAIGDGARELLICARLVPAALNTRQADLAAIYQTASDELVARLGAREPPWSRAARCLRIRLSGDLDAAERCYRDVREAARAEREPLLVITGFRNGAEMLLEDRRYAEAGPFVEQALAVSVAIGERWSRTELTADLAVVAAGLGDIARAERVLLEARALGRPSDVYAVARVAHCAALVRELQHRWDEAEAEFGNALQIFARSGFAGTVSPGFIRLDYAAFLARIGRAAEAATQLTTAEAEIGPQIGARGARVAALREAVGAPRSG
jgi:class 3 adenylate cyclase